MILENRLVASTGLQRQVSGLGYEIVAVVHDLEEACARAGESDLVMVDLQLGIDADGRRVSQRLRHEHHLPVVFFSHLDPGRETARCPAASAGCVRFPLSDHDLSAALQTALIRHRMEAGYPGPGRRRLAAQKSECLGVIGQHLVHDFNNVLQAMIGHVQLAGIDLPRNSPAQVALAKAVEAGMNGAVLCRQFMGYAMTAGQATVTELSAMVRETQPLLRCIVKKNVRVGYRLAEDLSPLDVAAAELRQILFNLALNSSEAIGPRRGELMISTGRRALAEDDFAGMNAAPGAGAGEYACLELADDGGGVPAAIVHRIFEPFFTTKADAGGLGLCAVADLARQHGGAVEWINREGEGATFRVYFPLRRLPAAG